MEELYNHMVKKSPGGIPYSDAVNLMLTLYCTLGILPAKFQDLELSKHDLGNLFSKLAKNGFIVGDDCKTLADSIVKRGEFWEELATKLFRGEISPDYSFTARASIYL